MLSDRSVSLSQLYEYYITFVTVEVVFIVTVAISQFETTQKPFEIFLLTMIQHIF